MIVSFEHPAAQARMAFILNWIGMCLMPPTKLERKRSSGPAGSAYSRRLANSRKITSSSSRARFAPRQKCSPIPNAMCGLGLRPISNLKGSSKTSSSRFADG